MINVVVWSKDGCSFCQKAMTVLDNYNVNYEVRKIGTEWTKEDLLEAIPDAKSLPQIVINGDLIGGYSKLVEYIENTSYNGTGHTL